MLYLLEFASLSTSIALVAMGLFLLQRSHGVAPLESLALAICLGMLVLSAIQPGSVSTVQSSQLLLPIAASGVLLICAHRYYVRWRLRVAGESTTMILSFALLNCCLLIMSSTTGARSLAIGLSDTLLIQSKVRLEFVIICSALICLLVLTLLLKHKGRTAALQLAKDDYRLLETFGIKADAVRARVLGASILTCFLGALFYLSLQESFSVVNSYALIVPTFAIAIAQNRLSTIQMIISAFLLIGSVQLLTQFTSELLRDFHQAIIFSLLVSGELIRRELSSTDFLSIVQRRIANLRKEPIRSNS
jgi:hypothetical protein